MGVRTYEEPPDLAETPRSPPLRPLLGAAAGVWALVLVVLLANGRPIGAGDTRANERVAASLVQEGDFDLDESPEVEPPFAVQQGGHRVSIYPTLSPVLAAPVFAAARAFFALDETGSALAGKLAAALLSALAAAFFFLATAARGYRLGAFGVAVLFALGTSVWSSSQALWQHPAAVLFLCATLLCLVRAEDDPAWAARAFLPLALAVAARHADVALAAVLAVGIALRWPRRLPWMIAWALPAVVFVCAYDWAYFGGPLRHGFSGSLARFAAPGVGHLGLLFSPAKGLLVFTPLAVAALAGLAVAWRRNERWWVGTLGGAVLAHWLLMGLWGEWHGGESWGPRLLTDALPLLFFFLPEGLERLPRLAPLLAVLSVGFQAVGAFAYDYGWERTHQRGGAAPPLWDVADNPILFHLERKVLIVAAPTVKDGKAFVREHPIAIMGPEGSRLSFARDRLEGTGSVPTFGDVHLQRGAQIENGKLHLQGRWAGVFLRVRDDARPRRLQLRIAARGSGVLYVGERSFWVPGTRWATYPLGGRTLIRHPYFFPESGGGDLLVTTGLGGGQADVEWITLVPPGEPIDAVRTPEG
jgi:hypothetical protein